MKKIHNIHANQEIYNPLSNKFHILCCFNEHGTMIIYDKITLLSQNATISFFHTKLITSLSHVQFKRCSEGWIRADKTSNMNRAQKRKRCLHVQRAQDFWLEDYNNFQILCWCSLEIEPSPESTCQLLLPPLPEPDCSTVLLISHLPGTCPPVKFLHLSMTCKRNSFVC